MSEPRVSVLFVCLGNICRSPTAQGAFQRLVDEAGLGEAIYVDSAGTHDYHIGKPPDERAVDAALQRGIDLLHLRARQATVSDLQTFDYIVAMDLENLETMQTIAAAMSGAGRLHLLMDFSERYGEREVPDPYFGGASGFELALDLIDDATRGLLVHIRREHGL